MLQFGNAFCSYDSGPAASSDTTASPNPVTTNDQVSETTTTVTVTTMPSASAATLGRPTDPTSSPIDLTSTTSPDLASTGDEETNPTQSTTINVHQNTSTHGLEGSDTTASPNLVTTNDQETETTTTISSASQEALGVLPYAVGGAVGATVVIIAIVLTVIIVSLLVRRSREKSYKLEPNKDIGLLSYDNALYDVGKETNTCSAQKWQLHFAVCGKPGTILLVLYMYTYM